MNYTHTLAHIPNEEFWSKERERVCSFNNVNGKRIPILMIRNCLEKIKYNLVLVGVFSLFIYILISSNFPYTYRFFYSFFLFGSYLSSMLSRPLKYKQQHEQLKTFATWMLFLLFVYFYLGKLFFGRFVSIFWFQFVEIVCLLTNFQWFEFIYFFLLLPEMFI